MAVVSLLPQSRGVLRGCRKGFIDWAFGPEAPDLTDAVYAGGDPEVLARTTPERRAAWQEAYLTPVLQRDVRDLANTQELT